MKLLLIFLLLVIFVLILGVLRYKVYFNELEEERLLTERQGEVILELQDEIMLLEMHLARKQQTIENLNNEIARMHGRGKESYINRQKEN